MTKNDHLSDATGLLAEKVASAVALVMLTFTPEIEKDYSTANDVYDSSINQRKSRHYIYNVQREHVIMFLSVSWIRTYLRKKWNCSFQRTVKKSDKLEEYCPNPYSFKFEVAACDRPSFANEAEKISAIKLLSNDLVALYHTYLRTASTYVFLRLCTRIWICVLHIH